jgi:uncharacterized protein YlxP (DUF503 family)
MYIGVARYDFLVPGSTSLKDKRKAVKRLVGALQGKFNASIAEVDFSDLRQRGAVGVSCISNSSFHARKMLGEMERVVRSQAFIEVISSSLEVVTPDG